MKVVQINNKHFRYNDELDIIQEVYWNETFEEWSPVLWENQMYV